MNSCLNTLFSRISCRYFPTAALSVFFPLSVWAETPPTGTIPVETNMSAFLLICFLLLLLTVTFFTYKRKFHQTSAELADLTGELEITRQRLTETGQNLEHTQTELKDTINRYQGIMGDAKVGLFQMEPDGTCSFINTALQEMSGLYPKKAQKEGLQSAIHPDDRAAFTEAWKAFEKGGRSFEMNFRFLKMKGEEVHVSCRASRVYNGKKAVESYIGWVSDESYFRAEVEKQETITARYQRFVDAMSEGYYKLTPEKPLPLLNSAEKMAESILGKMALTECNETFAAMYGAEPGELTGKLIQELQDGCGPFRSKENIRQFVEEGFKFHGLESIHQDANGTRLILNNNVIGLIENNALIGIWGEHTNISQQKRERTELNSKVSFLKRILDTLPADVSVKDTRCRYLYASRKLSDRTGIPQEEWLGKTIFEVIPATSRDHDHMAVDAMKSGKLVRKERPYEVRGRSGWMETVQIPLVSEEGLVEGVVGLSVDISNRKHKESEIVHYSKNLEKQLKERTGQLSAEKRAHVQTATELSETEQRLKVAEAEKITQEREFENRIQDHKRLEKQLRRSEEDLLNRQAELEQQLEETGKTLEAETGKRMKWEELLSLKEESLRKLESHSGKLEDQVKEFTEAKELLESKLRENQTALKKYTQELEEISGKHRQETETLLEHHKAAYDEEHKGRAKAERDLQKIEKLYESAQVQIKAMSEQHSDELQREVEERKAAAEKLIRNMEELDSLKQDFRERIEQETKTIKQELAKKQIREKALRQHEKDMEGRIKELEQLLHQKSREQAEVLQAREGAEVERQQMENRLEQMSKRQQELVARETQKLNLNIAEIRLNEVKLRKKAGDLMQEKDELEEKLHDREVRLQKMLADYKQLEADLEASKNNLAQLESEQKHMLDSQTADLRKQIRGQEQTEHELRDHVEKLQKEKQELADNLQSRNVDMAKALAEYRKLGDAYKSAQQKIKTLSDEQDAIIEEKTESLLGELTALKTSERKLKRNETDLQTRITAQQENINKLLDNLKSESSKRETAEQDLKELKIAYQTSQANTDMLIEKRTKELAQKVKEAEATEQDIKRKLETLQQSVAKKDSALKEITEQRLQADQKIQRLENELASVNNQHQSELRESLAEVKKISRLNSELVDELNGVLQESLQPIIKTSIILERAENLTREQKKDLADSNHQCRQLMEMMKNRSELTKLADGNEQVKTELCNLHELMADIDRQFSHRAEHKKLFFAVSFAQYQAAHNVPKQVETDEYKIRKVLAVLLNYALERTEKGRIGLHAAKKSSENDIINTTFELAYTGRDAHDALLSSLFGPESSESEELDMKYGLSLARRYANMLKGSISLEYRHGGVTALIFEVPFIKAAANIMMPEKESESAAGAA